MQNQPQRRELSDQVLLVLKGMGNIMLDVFAHPLKPALLYLETGIVKSYDPKTGVEYEHNTPLHPVKIVGIYLRERVSHPRSSFTIDPNTYEVKYA